MDQQTEKQPFDLKAATRVFSRIGFALLGYLVVANLLVDMLYPVLDPRIITTGTKSAHALAV